FHDLSPKFALSLDAGEALVMREHPHDLWLSALEVDGEVLLAFGLAGCPGHDAPLAAVALAEGHALVIAVLDAFLESARPEQTRMRHLLAAMPIEEFLQAVGRRLIGPLRRQACSHRALELPNPVGPGLPANALGVYQQSVAGRVAVGAAVPLGRLDASMLRAVAQLAAQWGDGTLRLTPWQSVLLPNVCGEHASTVMAGLHAAGLICNREQPLANIIACTGSAGCVKGLADTKTDAFKLAVLLEHHGLNLPVHLTACSRSCAAAHIAPMTLLATRAGHYDLYFRDTQQPGFGALRARDLTIEAVGALFAADSRSSTDD
ncbi:precorrin-3B synthase, partial [Pseudomonas sp. CCC3.2]